MLVALLTPVRSSAGLMVYQYMDSDPESKEIYLSGLLNGFAFANVELDDQKRARLYCPPPDLAIGTSMGAQLLEQGFKRYKKSNIDTLEIEPLLLAELLRVYPCRKSSGATK